MRLQREAASKIAFIQFLSSVAEHSVYVIAVINIQKPCVLETWIPYKNYPLHCLANYFPTAKLCVETSENGWIS